MKRGFSLLELLVVLALLGFFSVGLLSTLYQGQVTYQDQEERAQSVEEIRVAVDLIARYLRHAGNDPENYLQENGIAGIEVPGAGALRLRADITGSVPSLTVDPRESTGQPDGALESIHEDVVIALKGRDLMIDIGYGEQLLAQDIQEFNVDFFDRAGNAGVGPGRARRARVSLVAAKHLKVETDVLLRRSTSHLLYTE